MHINAKIQNDTSRVVVVEKSRSSSSSSTSRSSRDWSGSGFGSGSGSGNRSGSGSAGGWLKQEEKYHSEILKVHVNIKAVDEGMC